MRALELEYRGVVADLPADLRPLAADLPFHLGLAAHPPGSWEDYTRLAPFQGLPEYAAEGGTLPGQPQVAPEVLERYLRAHRCAGFFGLLADRLADGQVEDRPEWPRLLHSLLERWRQALRDATSNGTLADEAVRAAVCTWAEGLHQERELLGQQTLSMLQYVDLMSRKVAWLGTTSFCLILVHGQPARLNSFRLAFDLLLLSSQCLDDALDHAEDERLHGLSFPAALGYPPGGLLRTAPRVARLGAKVARAGGYLRLGEWLASRAGELEAIRAEGDPVQNELAAVILGETVALSCQQALQHLQPAPR